MDYIVMSQKDYVDFKIKTYHKGRGPTLSPDDLDHWNLVLNNEFHQMQVFVADRPHAIPLCKRIGLCASFAFMILGIVLSTFLAIKCLLE